MPGVSRAKTSKARLRGVRERYASAMSSSSDELVTLTIVANEIESDQIQQLLKFENIESMQRPTDTGAGSIGGSGAMSGSREILVKSEDLETAKAIIGEG
jgi:hypothetical protein